MAGGTRFIYLNHDYQGNELRGIRIENLGADPSGAGLWPGRIWHNTVTHQFKHYTGSQIEVLGTSGGGTVTSVSVASGGPIQNSGTSADPVIGLKTGGGAGAANGIMDTHVASNAAILHTKMESDARARANHSGTQIAATISNFDAQVRTSRLDQMAVPTADLSLNNHKITTLTDPSAAQDAATKNYVDTVSAGLSWKASVRVATTANGTLASAFANGQTVDGIALVTGDRILLKNQTAPAENGIYIVQASGAPVRSTDADAAAELVGAAVFVSTGTTNASTSWVQITPAPITVNTTSVIWTQYAGVGTYTAGAGLALSGNQFSLPTVPVNRGGTNATDAATARANLAVPTKLGFDLGDGTSVSYALTHNMNTRDLSVAVYRNSSPWDDIECEIERTTLNLVTVRTNAPLALGQARAVVMG